MELEQKAALTVTDIIAEIPSLVPNQNNNNSQNVAVTTFNLRGIGSSRTRVLVDGMRVADTNITSKVIRRITLHHALLSYLFGAVLLGLVINVVATLLK